MRGLLSHNPLLGEKEDVNLSLTKTNVIFIKN